MFSPSCSLVNDCCSMKTEFSRGLHSTRIQQNTRDFAVRGIAVAGNIQGTALTAIVTLRAFNAATAAMKVLCPKCNKAVELDYLEKVGEQKKYCSLCGVHIHAAYEKDDHREKWDVDYEKPIPRPENKHGLLGNPWLLISALIIFVVIFACIQSCEQRTREQEQLQEPIYGNSQDNDQWTGSSRAEG